MPELKSLIDSKSMAYEPFRQNLINDTYKIFEKSIKNDLSDYLGYKNLDEFKNAEKDTNIYQRTKILTPLMLLKNKLSKMDSFISLQKWEGVVLEIKDETFKAELNDLKKIGIKEEAEIYIEEISPDDKDLLKVGNSFYWHIGFYDKASGERTRTSFIRFVRLPKWNKLEIKLAELEADKLQIDLNWGLNE